MITKTLTQLLANIRSGRGTVETPTTLIPDSELTDWLNEEIRDFWEQIVPLCRGEFTTVSASTALTYNSSANACTFDLSTLSSPAFLALRGVDRDIGGNNFKRIGRLNFTSRSYVGDVSYLVVGTTLRIEPAIVGAGNYRFWYIGKPNELGGGVTSIDLPFGGDKYAIQGCLARLRERMEEDPAPHMAKQDQALRVAKVYIQQHSIGDQEVIGDVNVDLDDIYGGW